MAAKPKKSQAQKPESAKPDTTDYSLHIDKLRETEPHKNTNKYIESLINEATAKTKKQSYSSGFWNGLVFGVIVAFLFWSIVLLG